MKWKQFRLKTTTQAEDIVSSMLADLGIEGCSWIFCRISQMMTGQHI